MYGKDENISEDRMIRQVLAGDKDAFRLLVENYQNLVAHVVFRMVKSREDREDICQDVFMKIYQNPNYPPGSPVSPTTPVSTIWKRNGPWSPMIF